MSAQGRHFQVRQGGSGPPPGEGQDPRILRLQYLAEPPFEQAPGARAQQLLGVEQREFGGRG